MRKIFLTNVLIGVMILISNSSFAQNSDTSIAGNKTYSYAYIAVNGKLWSRKLNVEVDFGDTPEQLKEGKEYSELLTNKKSFAAVLNYMVEKQFELVNTLGLNYSSEGSGGTSGIVFIMKKKN